MLSGALGLASTRALRAGRRGTRVPLVPLAARRRLAARALTFALRLATGVLTLALALSALLGRHIAVLPGRLAGPSGGGRGLVALASLLALACRRAVVGLARLHDWSLTRSFLLASRLWLRFRWIGRFGFGRLLSLLRIGLLGFRCAGVALVRLFLFVHLPGRVLVLAGGRVLGRCAIGLGGLPIGFPLLRLILPLSLGASILLVRLGIRGVF